MEKTFDLLGNQLAAALTFARAAFDSSLELSDDVRGQQFPAREMFVEHQGRWFMDAQSLPGHPAIKALAIDQKHLWLEMAPLDLVRVGQTIQEAGLVITASQNGRLFKAGNETLLRITTRSKQNRDLLLQLEPRTLWTTDWATLSPAGLDTYLRFADVVFGAEAFLLPEEEDAPPTGRREMRLEQNLRLRLDLEQRPILTTELGIAGEMRLEFQQVLSAHYAIARMTPEERAEWALKDDSPAALAKSLHILQFSLAGQVKKAQPTLTWQEARKIARALINKAQAPGPV